MLIKTEVEKTKFIYKNEILINKKVIDYFNTNNLINIENIIDKLNFKIMDLTEVAKILNLIKKEDLPIIIKQMLSTKNINTKEITKFLIDNNINLDDFFNKMYLNNIENINFIFSCMVKNQNKKDYGLSLF